MAVDTLNDYRWLVSAEGTRWCSAVADDCTPLLQQAKRLRRQLSAGRVHRLLELLELRQRAAAKFEAASSLFFTARALEQATDQWIAHYKSQRFGKNVPVVDLCCGIGGDLFALAARGRTLGVDFDPVHALLAETNCQVLGLSGHRIRTADAADFDPGDFAAWHMDPDRRTTGRRTTRLENSSPSTSAIEAVLQRLPHAALKVAPATELPERWKPIAERQWIGSGRECKQQVIWFGDLAVHPGHHSAAVVQHRGGCSDLLVGPPARPIDVARKVGRYVCEPHAAVLAAHLTGVLARQYGLLAIGTGHGYLTSDQLIGDRLVSCFEVLDVLPFDLRRLRAAVRHYSIGHLEVKKRGVRLDPDQVRRSVEGNGDESATLLITQIDRSTHAVLCRRQVD